DRDRQDILRTLGRSLSFADVMHRRSALLLDAKMLAKHAIQRGNAGHVTATFGAHAANSARYTPRSAAHASTFEKKSLNSSTARFAVERGIVITLPFGKTWSSAPRKADLAHRCHVSAL